MIKHGGHRSMIESILGVFKSISGIFTAFINFFKELFGQSTNSETDNSNDSFDNIVGNLF